MERNVALTSDSRGASFTDKYCCSCCPTERFSPSFKPQRNTFASMWVFKMWLWWNPCLLTVKLQSGTYVHTHEKVLQSHTHSVSQTKKTCILEHLFQCINLILWSCRNVVISFFTVSIDLNVTSWKVRWRSCTATSAQFTFQVLRLDYRKARPTFYEETGQETFSLRELCRFCPNLSHLLHMFGGHSCAYRYSCVPDNMCYIPFEGLGTGNFSECNILAEDGAETLHFSLWKAFGLYLKCGCCLCAL